MQASYKSDEMCISLPLIHVLIEKAVGSSVYVSTCLEFSQACESETPHDSVNKLVFLMFQYFFKILGDKDGGREYLYREVKKPYNNHLWDIIREYNLKESEDELRYIEMTLQGKQREESFNDLKERLKSKQKTLKKFILNKDTINKRLKKELVEKEKPN